MKHLSSILWAGILLAACSAAPKKDAPAKKITKINVDQILPDSTRWVNSDTVIYTPDGRLAQVDFIHFCYTDSSVVAQCDSTPPNVRSIRRCELVFKPGKPVTLRQNYYSAEGYDRGYSEGLVTSTDSLVTLELKHYMPEYDQHIVEYLNWRMNKEGLLTNYTNSYTMPDGTPVSSEGVYTYDPASKMTSQDLTVLAFYMSPASVEDLVLMTGGYLPALAKDIPVKEEMGNAEQTYRSEVVPSFDEQGRCTGSKNYLNGKLSSTITVEY